MAKVKNKMPQNPHNTGFRGPSPEVGKATQCKPGESGNPGGRPKSKPITDLLRKLIEEDPEQAKAIVRKLLEQAKKGSLGHFKELTDRIEGPVVQQQESKADVMLKVAECIAEGRKRVEALREERQPINGEG